jgi:hypothetical protein
MRYIADRSIDRSIDAERAWKRGSRAGEDLETAAALVKNQSYGKIEEGLLLTESKTKAAANSTLSLLGDQTKTNSARNDLQGPTNLPVNAVFKCNFGGLGMPVRPSVCGQPAAAAAADYCTWSTCSADGPTPCTEASLLLLHIWFTHTVIRIVNYSYDVSSRITCSREFLVWEIDLYNSMRSEYELPSRESFSFLQFRASLFIPIRVLSHLSPWLYDESRVNIINIMYYIKDTAWRWCVREIVSDLPSPALTPRSKCAFVYFSS